MSQETTPTNELAKTSPTVEAMNKHLDDLLGMDVRKPGSAAMLPAVIRITETLEPAGGKDFPVFPPSYAGEGTNAPPVYDLNGIEWGEVLHEKSAKDGTKRITRYIKRARHCTMDSPQSHANRTEIAFRDDPELLALVPQAEAKIPRKPEFADQSNANLLALPHRVADFRVRASNQKETAAEAIKAFAKGDALPLLRFMPTSIIFGFWDSRAEGYQHKHSRILLTRIDAFGVVPCEKHSLYTGPYSKDECASVVLDNDNLAEELSGYDAKAADDDEKNKASKEAKKWADKMAERGFSNALASGLGGVFAERIERLALISLTDIASIFCFNEPNKEEETQKEGEDAKKSQKPTQNPELTNAARRYLLALALLAENYPRSMGSYRLRSGCELIVATKRAVELRGNGAESEAAKALLNLCENPKLLIAVADDARTKLGIQTSLPSFQSDANSLRAFLGKDIKSEKDANKEKKAAEKAAKKAKEDAEKARTRATKAAEDAIAAEQKASASNKPKDQKTAENKRAKMTELSAKADEMEKLATEAAAKLTEFSGQSGETPAAPDADSPAEPQPPTPEA